MTSPSRWVWVSLFIYFPPHPPLLFAVRHSYLPLTSLCVTRLRRRWQHTRMSSRQSGVASDLENIGMSGHSCVGDWFALRHPYLTDTRCKNRTALCFASWTKHCCNKILNIAGLSRLSIHICLKKCLKDSNSEWIRLCCQHTQCALWWCIFSRLLRWKSNAELMFP